MAVNSIYGPATYQIRPVPESPLSGTVHGNSRGTSATPGRPGVGDTYEWGTHCTLTATPNPGRAFEGWYVDGIKESSNANWSFTAREPLVAMAKFKTTTGYYTVEVDVNGSRTVGDYGIVTGGGSYREGSVCTVTVTPSPNASSGLRFIGWEDMDALSRGNGMSTSQTYSFVVTRDIRLQAIYQSSRTN